MKSDPKTAMYGGRDLAIKKARAFAGDGFNADFEELLINKVAELLNWGVTKEQLLKFLDLMLEAKQAPVPTNDVE